MESLRTYSNIPINGQLIPYELSNHFWTYVEERLYVYALSVLTPLLTTHTPPTPHIALLHTLSLHPSLTTRTVSIELHSASNRSHSLLNLILARHGPHVLLPACYFQQISLRNTRRSLSTDPPIPTSASPSEYDAPESIPLAHGGSVFHRASDFWHALGWAMVCSVVHPPRWRIWLPWLRFICQLLEDDWQMREKLSTPENSQVLKRSLIYSYVTSASEAQGSVRRIMRAIFADGDVKSQNEFKEVWKGELKGPKEEGKPKKREVDVNVDAEIYGDYLASEDSDEDDETTMETTRPPRRKSTRNGTKQELVADGMPTPRRKGPSSTTTTSKLDGSNIASLQIRTRLLDLLSSVSVRFPSTFTPVSELYTFYVEFIQPLPLPTFQYFVLSGIASFTPDAHTTLCEYLLYRLIDSDNYVPTEEAFLTQEKIERSFLPFAANGSGAVGNAKMALLLESMLRYLATEGKLKGSEKLRDAVEEGIKARTEKAGERDRRKKSHAKGRDEDEAWTVLLESGERMRDVVERVQRRQ